MNQPPPYQSNPPVVVVQPVVTTSRPPKKCMGASMGVGIAALIVGIAITALFLVVLINFSVYHGSIVVVILPGPLLIITGILGIAYGSRGNRGVAVAYLVLSIITLIASTIPSGYGLFFWWIFFIVPTLAVGAILEFIGFALAVTSVVIASVVVCCSKTQDQVQNVQVMQTFAPTHPQHMQPSVQASAPGHGRYNDDYYREK